HRVLVFGHGRPRLGERINQIQLLDAARVRAGDKEALRVRRPGDVRPCLAVAWNLRFSCGRSPPEAATESASEAAEAVILLAVRRELNGLGFFTLVGEIQVEFLGEDKFLAVGRVRLVIERSAAARTPR